MNILFQGNESAYGQFQITEKRGLKLAGRASTIRQPPRLNYWVDHLSGKQGLGIIPINEDNECWWGVIDIDDYEVDTPALLASIKEHRLPLVVCRSKSGGAHVFLFLRTPADAGQLQDKLQEIGAFLGFGNVEIFPKQRKIHAEKGDVGNWLNMPYFNYLQSKRYGFGLEGNALPIEAFIEYAKSQRIALQSFPTIIQPTIDNTPIANGPPCLQHLAKHGVPEGNRNNGLLALGTYARKAYPDKWERYLEEYNRKFIKPSLDSDEVALIIQSLSKHEYFYRCSDQPIKSFCNAAICRTRKFGIGPSGGMPLIAGLTKINSDEPVWFMDVEGGRLELTTQELQNQHAFQLKCMAQLSLMPISLKADKWAELIQSLMDKLMVVEVSSDVNQQGKFLELLEAFCVDRAAAETPEEMMLGKVYTFKGKHYFRLMDLEKYLLRQYFTFFNRTQISVRIRNMGGDKYFWHLKHSGINSWWVYEFKRGEPPPLPALEEGM